MNITVTEFESATVCINRGGATLKMKDRSSCSLIVTKSGEIAFTQNGKTVISSPESSVFIPQGASYLNTCLETAESMMVNFQAETDITEITALPLPNISRLEEHYADLCSLSVRSLAKPLDFSEKCRAVSEIYSVLSLLTDKTKSRSDTEKLFDMAAEYIIASVSDPSLDCALVASHLNISEVYLRRLFIKYSGIPTWKYIRKIRLEKARQLLSDKVSVKNAATMTGFSDVYSFSRAYSGYFGYPPSKT
ncbi:MAG: helix-turn-helix domain-containing protein [Ruminococcaceae bacterium]|nr:helix-turn-helix domain-containing protein [Oscillospiraceae bacterium]